MRLRIATPGDADLLRRWEQAPQVREAGALGWDWDVQLHEDVDWRQSLVAEVDGRAIGFIEWIDTAREPEGWFGDIGEGIRAIDLWIGEADALGQGHGTAMMRPVLAACFADPATRAVIVDPLQSNLAAQRFYRRLGFQVQADADLHGDACRLMRLERADWVAAVEAPVLGLDPAQVLEFWFGEPGPATAVAQRQAALWWSKDEAVDARIARDFDAAVLAAGSGGLQRWLDTPEGWLALLIVCDQFPRNIHRDTPLAFAFDVRARQRCRQGIEAGLLERLDPLGRVFALLPLEHAEDAALQAECVQRFQALAASVGEADRQTFEGFLDFARRHQVVIDRFGRYPHRNRILGRRSTPEERAYLAQPGAGF